MSKIKKIGQQGFTIVELLIVIVIIGILAALVFVQFNGMQQRGRDAERKADIRLIESKLAEHYADEGSYPALLDELSDVPADALADPSDGTYAYVQVDDGDSYTLTATLESEEPATYTRQP